MEEIKCIFCDKSSDKIVIEENGFKGRKCPDCGLIYVSPRPSCSEILNFYGHDQAFVSAESHLSLSYIKRIIARHHLKIIQRFIKTGSVLEIGAGAGFFLDEARKKGFEVFGIELNTILANYIRNTLRIPCAESALEVSLFNEKKYDLIYHCDVMSHFYEPFSDLRKMNEMLKSGGCIIFETGNFGDVNEKYYYLNKVYQYPDHLFFYGVENLKILLRNTGFELVKIYRYSLIPELYISGAMNRIIRTVKSIYKMKLPESEQNKELIYTEKTERKKKILRQWFINIYNYFFYFLRYKFGKLSAKNDTTQTIIVIARKANR